MSSSSQNMAQNYNLRYNAVVLKKIGKTFKSYCFKTLFGQKLDQHEPRPKSNSISFSGNNRKEIKRFQELLILSKIS